MTDELTYNMLSDQVASLRAQDELAPTAIRLGATQRTALEQYVREISGQSEVGPVISFDGLDVVNADGADELSLVWPEAAPAPAAEPVQPVGLSGPEAPPPPQETPENAV